MSPLLVAVLGTAAMASFAMGLWLPAYRRQRTVRRRLGGFVLAGTAEGFAIDLGGQRRARARRAARSTSAAAGRCDRSRG